MRTYVKFLNTSRALLFLFFINEQQYKIKSKCADVSRLLIYIWQVLRNKKYTLMKMKNTQYYAHIHIGRYSCEI